MKKTLSVTFFFFFVLFLASAQDFTGGLMRHLETGTLFAAVDDPTAAVTRVNSSYSVPFARDDSFDTTDTSIFIATSLRDFHTESVTLVRTTSAVHIEILNPRLNLGKNALTVTINTEPSVINVTPDRVSVIQVRLYYIVIGSGFQGSFNAPIESSAIFARNGKLDLAVIPNAANPTPKYDFSNPQNPSPFTYTYDPLVHTGCGAVRRDGKWIIEFGVDCEYLNLMVFITGFESIALPAGPSPSVSLDMYYQQEYITDPGFVLPTRTQPQFYTEVVSPSNVDDGIFIDFPALLLPNTRVQFSLIAVSLREYDSAAYPTQLLFPNQFQINVLNSHIDYASTGVRAPGGLGGTYNNYALGATAGSNAANLILNPPFYQVNPSEVSHFFCGDSRIDLTLPGNTDINFETNHINIGTAGLDLVINDLGGVVGTIINLRRSCFMITGLTDICEQNANIPPLDTSVPFQATAVPTTNTGTDFFTALPPPTTYDGRSDPNYIEQLNGNLLIIEQTFSVVGTNVYRFNYGPNALPGKAYEGVLHLSANFIPLNPSGVVYTFAVKIQIFGNVVYRGTQDLGLQTTIHFGFINTAHLNSEVIITYTSYFNDDNLAPAAAIPFVNYLEFGIVAHTNVINSTGDCVATCDPIESSPNLMIGINFQSVPPRCVTCDTNLNLIFRPDLGTCGCGVGQVEINGACDPCDIPLCAICDAGKTTCEMCVENSNYINALTPASGCKCDSHFYRSDIKCLACPAGCVQCQNPTTCSACVSNSNTRGLNTAGCPCLPGFYETGTAVCPRCSAECKTCTGTSTNCLSCRLDGHFMQQGSTCVCEPGYFRVTHTDGTATCEPCSSDCSKCILRADNCVECQAFRVRGSDNRCVCQSGYIEFEGKCIDSLCSAIPYCQSCVFNLQNGLPLCKACTDNRVPSADKSSCVCQNGYFEKAGKCEPCGEGCKKCVSATECTVCADQAYNNYDGTCTCPQSNFISVANNNIRCQLCDANCLICENSASKCIECRNGFISVNKECVCPQRTYPTLDRLQCLSCGTGCSSCKSGDICDSCEPGYTASDNKCVLSCPTGTFNAGDKCQQCSDFCNHCTSSLSCSGCMAGYKLFAGSCRATCPEGTFALGALCVACRQPCATCNVQANACLTCIDTYFLSNGVCLSDCPEGTYFDSVAGSCISCSSNCFNCYESPDNCISCRDGTFLVDGKCLNSCPYVVIDGQCTNNCPEEYYLSGKTCRPCEGDCATCSSATKCETCRNNLLVYKGGCVSDCPTNTMKLNDNYCLDCDASCIGCSGSPFSCLKCQNGYYQFQDRCVKDCPSGFYLDYSAKNCKQCDAGCTQCIRAGQCIVCEGGAAPVAGICANSCGINCLTCSSGSCTKCADGFIISEGKCQSYCPAGSSVVGGFCVCNSGYLHLNQCVSSCPEKFVAEGKNCVACREPCVTCSGSANECTSCKEGYKIDQVTKRCVPNVDCPRGFYSSLIGGCRLICPVNHYFFDSACYEGGCPLGYVPDQESRSCIEQDIPTGCTFPFFLQGSSCVKTCQPGFYPNAANRICEACPPNCYTCTELKVCVACVSNFVLKDNQCLATTSCPTGYYKHNDNCVSQCPVGTIPENSFCLRLCPAGSFYLNFRCYPNCPTSYRTSDACVEQCPPNYLLKNNVCIAPSKECALNQYYDSVSNTCYNCRSPCSTCVGAAHKCTSCVTNYYLADNSCFPKTNIACPEKCSTCLEPNVCAACASGYVNTGDDCVKNLNVLQEVKLQEISKTIRGSTVFIQVRPTIIPNGLPSTISGQFFILSPAQGSPAPVSSNQWISGNDVYVALTFAGSVPSASGYLVPNMPVLSDLYLNMGYKLANAFLQVDIYPSLPAAPSSLTIPITAAGYSKEKLEANVGKLNYALSLDEATAARVFSTRNINRLR